MALSWDKEKFDKNHDGKLTGSENTNWEIFWFGLGLGFGDKEDDEIYIAPKLIPDKKAAEIIRISLCFVHSFSPPEGAVSFCSLHSPMNMRRAFRKKSGKLFSKNVREFFFEDGFNLF